MGLSDFQKDPLYSNVLEYWCDEWKDISHQVKEGNIGIEVVNIRLILLDVISEYELNKFKSDNNRKIYISLIENLLSNKHLKVYREELLILKANLEKKNTQNAYVVAKELSKQIDKDNFAVRYFEEVYTIIEKKEFSKDTRKEITRLTKNIIIDLATSGRDIKDIEDMIEDILGTYIYVDDKLIPYYRYLPNNLSDEQIIEFIDNIDLKGRLEQFKSNLSNKIEEYQFVFPVWGLNAADVTLREEKLLGMEIYDPLREQRYPEAKWFDDKFNIKGRGENEIDNLKNISRCNLIIRTKAISRNTAKKIALSKYQLFINITNYEFASKHREFYWDGQYFGEIVGRGSSGFFSGWNLREESEFRRTLAHGSPMTISKNKMKRLNMYTSVIQGLQEKNMSIEANAMASVIELMSKAIWETDENKLLNYWICLESMSNIAKSDDESTFSFIKNTLPNMYFLGQRFFPIRRLFDLTDIYTRHSMRTDDTINIPQDFLKDIGVYAIRSEDTSISLTTFYKRYGELKAYVSKKKFLDLIEDAEEFYQDNKYALKRLKEKRSTVELTISYIYKSRNQIVHNGYVARELIPFLVNFAEGYAKSLFESIIDLYHNKEYNLQEYYIKEKYEGELLEKRLSGSDYFDLGRCFL